MTYTLTMSSLNVALWLLIFELRDECDVAGISRGYMGAPLTLLAFSVNLFSVAAVWHYLI